MKKFVFSLFLATAVLLSMKCKDDDAPINPCEGKEPFKACFEIGETIGDSLFVTDTIVRSSVTFSAGKGYDSYRWHIGTDTTLRTDREFNLNFDEAFIGHTFTATLIASQSPDKVCFPDDDGVDTLTKSFYIGCANIDIFCSSQYPTLDFPYVGKYEGNLTDAPDHIFTVQIVNFGIDPIPNDDVFWYNLRVYNLPEGCGGPLPGYCGGIEVDPSYGTYDIQWGFRGFYAYGIGWGSVCCPSVELWGKLDPSDSNTITVDMEMDGIKKQFIGIRAQ